jgi:hypothetical protein
MCRGRAQDLRLTIQETVLKIRYNERSSKSKQVEPGLIRKYSGQFHKTLYAYAIPKA